MDYRVLLTSFFDDTGVAGLLERGGPVVVILLCLSVLALAIAIVKTIQLQRARAGQHGRAWRAVRDAQAGRRVDLEKLSDGPLSARTVAAMLRHPQGPCSEGARDAAESFAIVQLNGLARMIGALDIIAQIAPLLGLFGTVLGMIEAFQALEGAGSAVDPSVLAGGIWVALLTTAVGLGVAMPASIFTAWLDGRVGNERVTLDAMIGALASGSAAEPEAKTGRLIAESAVPSLT